MDRDKRDILILFVAVGVLAVVFMLRPSTTPDDRLNIHELPSPLPTTSSADPRDAHGNAPHTSRTRGNQQATTVKTTDWVSFKNKRYNYSLRHPPDAYVNCGAPPDIFAEDYWGVCITADPVSLQTPHPWIRPSMRIDILDPTVYITGDEGEPDKDGDFLSQDLDDYARSLWQLNKQEEHTVRSKTVGPLEQVTVAGRNAYRFTVTRTLSTRTGGSLLNVPYVIVILEDDQKLKYRIRFPNDTIYDTILSTMKLD